MAAMLIVFPKSLIISSRLPPTPYISRGIQLRTVFTIGGGNNAPPITISRNPTIVSVSDMAELMIAKSRISPKRVIRTPIDEIRYGLNLSESLPA